MSPRDRPRAREELERLTGKHFPADAEVINSVLLPAITFVQSPRTDGRIALRLGGAACLPESIAWPRNGDRELFFVAAVDLTVVGNLEAGDALPRSGFLFFFFDIVSQSWGLEIDDALSASPRHRHPHATDSQYMFQNYIDPAEVHDAAATWTMPMSFEPCVASTAFGSWHGDDYFARRADFTAIWDSQPMGFQMLGWPYYVQPNSRQRSVASDATGKPLEALTDDEVAEWRLLMQFNKWDEYGGTNWGGPGGGMLEFWIRDVDLRARRFDRVWIQMDAC
jgi:uncharacterized protein YwqG